MQKISYNKQDDLNTSPFDRAFYFFIQILEADAFELSTRHFVRMIWGVVVELRRKSPELAPWAKPKD